MKSQQGALNSRTSIVRPACAALTVVALCVVYTLSGCALQKSDKAQRSDPFSQALIPDSAGPALPASINAAPASQVVRRLPPIPVRLASGGVSLTSLVVEAQHDEAAAPSAVVPIPMHSELEVVPKGPSLPAPAPTPAPTDGESFVVDLATALRLGGANSLQVQLARERVVQSQIRWQQAKAARLPSLQFGVGWNRHDGRLQATEGLVGEFDRNSLFVGGAAGLDSASLAGGASGPSRLVVNYSLADAHFEPLVARQYVDAASAAESKDTSDTLLEIATAYFDLLEARAETANARSGLTAAEEMVKLTTDHFDANTGSEAEIHRAKTELAVWQRAVEEGQRKTIGAAAELARMLRLDPNVRLLPAEGQLAPIELVHEQLDVQDLVATALAARPEMAEHQALVQARIEQMRQEHWRPWLPNVQVGASGGVFGGGERSTFRNTGGRSDVDVLAVWELKNLGRGNVLANRERSSQVAQAELGVQQMQDKIIAEVIFAAADVASYQRQVDAARAGLGSANLSFQSNLDRIRDAVGLPIELIQAIRARTDSQNAYSRAISDFNRAQYRLYHAIGQTAIAAFDDDEER